jgi:hypothetical protein
MANSSKSKNSLGNFYDKEIYVRIKNGDLSCVEGGRYCDYRVGCSICEKGNARVFRTNLLSIANKNFFLLNKLDVILDDIDDTYELPVYYQTNDPGIIKLLFNCFKKFNMMTNCCDKISLTNGLMYSSHLASIFRDDVYNDNSFVDINKVHSVHICNMCFKWLIFRDNELSEKFAIINPLKIFWADVMNDEFKDVIEYKDQGDKEIFNIVDD